MVSEVDYKEVYHEVPFSIPPGDLKFFFFVPRSRQDKNIFLWFGGNLKGGSCLQHYTGLKILQI